LADIAGHIFDSVSAGSLPARLLMNEAAVEPFPLESLLPSEDGLPRSLPFQMAAAIFKREQVGDFGAPGGPLQDFENQ